MNAAHAELIQWRGNSLRQLAGVSLLLKQFAMRFNRRGIGFVSLDGNPSPSWGGEGVGGVGPKQFILRMAVSPLPAQLS